MLLAKDSLSYEVLNTLPENLCILDRRGNIVFVNQAWINFERDNTEQELTDWSKVNYLDVCDKSANDGFQLAQQVAQGIREVANEKQTSFKIEYPCHSPTAQQWFSLNCMSVSHNKDRYLLVQHANVTQKVQADINSNIDPLTLVGNRRAFNQFLDREWRRCLRSHHPISAVIIDVDNFKQFNDDYGHLQGDECLKKISHVLKALANRPSDIFCRYGGEEFIYILGNTDRQTSLMLCDKIHQAVRSLKIIHESSSASKFVTVSIGVACVNANLSKNKEQLVDLADRYLYQAKSAGKNTTGFHDCRHEICQPSYCWQFSEGLAKGNS